VKKGAADRSYGVQVAKLAGLPQSVVDRAKLVLEALEKGERDGGKAATLIDDLPLFRAAAPAPASRPQKTSELETRLTAISPDELTPIEALRLVYELKGLLS
jgi:DNA mismatch repair protein MutS